MNLLGNRNYWKLSDHALEILASKYKIGEYGYTNGRISRKIIIEQLVFRDKFINSFIATIISIIALVVSAIALFINNQ